MSNIDYKKEYEKWLNADFVDDNSKKVLLSMKHDESLVKECFYDYLSFGTGGMRGIMGVGINRMNIYMVRRATQGLANFIIENKKDKVVVITHDSRNNARIYAMEVARTLVANNIKVYITKSLRPTPFLSYIVRYYKASAGVNITASHNTKEYNGYKLYLSDGAQFSYPDDEKVIKSVNKISDISLCKTITDTELKKSKLYNEVDAKVENSFLNDALSMMVNKEYIKKNGKNLKIVYTPLHGTGSFFLIDAFKKAGFSNVNIVKSQDDKCGDFKTVTYPNPEKKEAFFEAIKIAKNNDSDIIVATDPDADRLGVYVKVAKGKYLPLTGNELASIILEYILYFAKYNGKNLKEYFVAKSFVTTRLIDDICKRYNVDLISTLTGFKWIGKAILQNKKKFIFGAEESYGFLVSDYVRDKDSITATLLTCEIACILKNILSCNMIDLLNMMHDYYGTHISYGESIDFKGVEGTIQMKNLMKDLRENPLKMITDIKILKMEDYKISKVYDYIANKETKLNYPPNDTIRYYLDDDSIITIRPSGTEPKIKMYYDVIDESEELAKNKIDILSQFINKIMKRGM